MRYDVSVCNWCGEVIYKVVLNYGHESPWFHLSLSVPLDQWMFKTHCLEGHHLAKPAMMGHPSPPEGP